MAHGDYHCCMICDCKMDYASGDARTKEDVCTGCLRAMRDEIGTVLLTPEEFTSHLAGMEPDEALKLLAKLEFSACFYPNPVDEFVKHLGQPKET